MAKIKIKAKLKGDVITAKVMIPHAMMTYDQAKSKGVEANFITHITGMVGDKVVYELSTSQFLSKNPTLKFKFKNAKKGEELTINTVDLSGAKQTAKKKIK